MEKAVELAELGPPAAAAAAPKSSSSSPPSGCIGRLQARLRTDSKFRGVVIAVAFGVQGALATLLFFTFSRVLANAGRQTNSTWNAISETMQLYQTVFGFLLVSLSSQVARAHQDEDFEEVGRLIKLGVLSSVLLGVVGEVLVLSTAPSMLTLFEGSEVLLEDTPALVRWSGASFALGVVNSTLVGILFGKADLIFVAAVFCPALLIAVAGAGVFIASGSELLVLVAAAALVSFWMTAALGGRVWRSRRKYGLTSLANVSLGHFRTFVDAAGNVAIKTLSTAVKVFLTFLFGTRLNNATGSVLTILQTLSAPLLGLAAFLGVGATIFVARLLAAGHVAAARRFAVVATRVVVVSGALFLATLAVTEHGATLLVSYTEDEEDKKLYAQIASPLNMWIWAGGLVLQAPAVVFDGLLVAAGEYRFIGALYGVDFGLVFLPTLLATQLAPGLPSGGGGGETAASGGFTRLTGIFLALLLHSALRCAVGGFRVYAKLAELGEEQASEQTVRGGGGIGGILASFGDSCDGDEILEAATSPDRLAQNDSIASDASTLSAA